MKQDRISLIKQRLQSLTPEHLIVYDESAQHAGHAGAQQGHGHFAIEITSEMFRDKNLVARHRLIYQVLGDLMHTDIHALRIQAKAPGE